MQLTLLVGSGISMGAGMPCVSKITKQVLSGANVRRHTDGVYRIVNDSITLQAHERCQATVAIAWTQRVHALCSSYFSEYFPDSPEPNYEDIANIAKQVKDSLSGEYENPALLPLLQNLRSELGLDADALKEQAGQCHDYIADTVWQMLYLQDTDHLDLDYLKVIADVCHKACGLDIFDLNHDLVLETALG